MEKKYRTMILTAFKDLPQTLEERGLIILTVSDMNGIPVSMEYFGKDKLQRAVIRKFIEDSDVCIVFIVDRKGILQAKDLEPLMSQCLYAGGIGKIVIPVIHKDAPVFQLTSKNPEDDEYKKVQEIKNFLDQQACVFWDSLAELENNLRSTLSQVLAADPPIGWVRGNTAVSRIAASEMERMVKEIAKLKIENGRLNTSPEKVKASSEEGKKRFEVKFKFKVDDAEDWYYASFEWPLDKFFAYDSLYLMNQAEDQNNRRLMGALIVEMADEIFKQQLIFARKRLHTYTMTLQNYLKLMAKFQYLGWVEIRGKSNDKKTIRGLTDKGTQHMYELVLEV